jgi:hypothetical protein
MAGHSRSRHREQSADGLLECGGPLGVVDAFRSGRAERPRKEHVVEGADVALQLLGGLALRGASVVGGLGSAPGSGASPGVVKEAGAGQDR